MTFIMSEIMVVFIILYRGINVVGKNPVKMERLRAMHERLGHQDVITYLQSGNVILQADGSPQAIARQTSDGFVKEFGFAPKVLVIPAKEWGAIVKANPFAKFAAEDPRTVHAGICQGLPSESALKALLARTAGTEAFGIGKRVVYLHAPDGFGTSKFAAGMEKACGAPMTVRNWRTVEALWQLASTTGNREGRQ